MTAKAELGAGGKGGLSVRNRSSSDMGEVPCQNPWESLVTVFCKAGSENSRYS